MSRVLIFTRGEIAARACRACATLGLEPVLFLTPADDDALRASLPGGRVRWPHSEPARSFLDLDALRAALAEARADAVYPGYGFLAESERLAAAVAEAGARFVGPSPDALALLADKARARGFAARCGIAALTVPDPPRPQDYPVMLKAARGAAGRGNVIVTDPETLRDARARLSALAERRFGDGRVLLERFVDRARHVELQVAATEGVARVLGTRDCSVQQRQQKLLEEGPAPDSSRAALAALVPAVEAAFVAIGYRGVATVEVLWEPARGALGFLEVNPRIQVEHTVTEALLGVDLVAWQLREALGLGARALLDAPPPEVGHALELRLYATGLGHLSRFEVAPGPGVRWDRGAAAGSAVTAHYDPLLAKLIVSGGDRGEALARAREALASCRVEGVPTNLGLLRHVVAAPEVAADRHTTRWLEQTLLATRGVGAGPARGLAWKHSHRADPTGATRVSPAKPSAPGARDRLLSTSRGSGSAGPDAVAPMAGVVVEVHVAIGDLVAAGAPLLTLEAMKLEVQVVAPRGGPVTSLMVAAGEVVDRGARLATIGPAK